MSDSKGWTKESVLDYLLPMLCAHGVTSFEWEGLKVALDPTLLAKSFKPCAVQSSAPASVVK